VRCAVSGESVLTRAVRIFEAFTPDDTVLSVTQIARRARLHPATASRLVAKLEAHGLLVRYTAHTLTDPAGLRAVLQCRRG